MKLPFFNIKVNSIAKDQLFREILDKAKKNQSSYLCAVNSHMTVEAQKDGELKEAIMKADWAVADGAPVAWAFSYLNKLNQERIAGMDITPELVGLAEKHGLVLSVYGNTDDILEDFKKYVLAHYPKLKIGTFISPPFRELSSEELNHYINELNGTGTNILFVSLGCPKQEKWMLRNGHRMKGVSLGIGNAINTTIGKEKRPPQFIQNLGLEWFVRLIQNPKRLFKRYLYTNSKFCLIFLRHLIKG